MSVLTFPCDKALWATVFSIAGKYCLHVGAQSIHAYHLLQQTALQVIEQWAGAKVANLVAGMAAV